MTPFQNHAVGRSGRASQFTLRTLLAATAVVGLAMAWVHAARSQREACAALALSNPAAVVLYGHQVDAEGRLALDIPPAAPEWLRSRVGIDYLSSVAGVELFYATDADIECLLRLSALVRLSLDRSIDLTDAGLARLSRLKHLRNLALNEADQITDDGLQSLARLTNLVELHIDVGRRMTSSGIERLRRRLPHCRILLGGIADADVALLSRDKFRRKHFASNRWLNEGTGAAGLSSRSPAADCPS